MVVVVEGASEVAVAGFSEDVAGASEAAGSSEVVEAGSTAGMNLTKGARVKRPLRGV